MPADNDIRLDIATPKGPFLETFLKTTKVQEVVTTVISRMGLDAGERFDLVFNGSVLDPVERPLVSFGIGDEAKLELVATGSGV